MQITKAQENWNRIKQGAEEMLETPLVNHIYPLRDFGMSKQPAFRSAEDFDAKFGVRR